MNIISKEKIKRGLVLTLKSRIIIFSPGRLLLHIFILSSILRVKGSDIKEDNDQASEIDGEDGQASGISAKSKPFTVNENKRENPHCKSSYRLIY